MLQLEQAGTSELVEITRYLLLRPEVDSFPGASQQGRGHLYSTLSPPELG